MKVKDKKVFVDLGSEDGNLGVYSNLKLTLENAIKYTGSDSFMEIFENNGKGELIRKKQDTILPEKNINHKSIHKMVAHQRPLRSFLLNEKLHQKFFIPCGN